ncbi:MAG: TonB-dependent receptor, partial [Sphingobacteriales bacterium]
MRQVEFLSNPPVRYEVNGNTGIINIRTGGAIKGIIGNLDLSSSQGTNNWLDLSALINYGTGKIAISGYAALHRGGYLTKNIRQRQLAPSLIDQQTSSLDKWNDPVFRVAVDYAHNSKSTFGGIVEREASTNHSSYETYVSQGNTSYQTNSENPNTRYWNTYNLNYRYQDTLGTELSIDLDRADFSRYSEINLYTLGQPDINYLSKTAISISTAKADYTHSWKTNLKVEVGVKIASIQTRNSQDLNLFRYAERIRASYASLSRTYDHLGWQLGVRLEHTDARGESAGAIRPDTNYFNLLPSAYLTWRFDTQHHLRLSLSRRIKRPNYNDLEPFVYTLDPLNQQTGNPLLRVQRNDQAELTYTFKDRVTLTSTYSRGHNYFAMVYRQLSNILIQQPDNAGKMETLNFDLNYPIKLSRWWNILTKVNIGNDHFDGNLLQGRLDE